MKKVYGFSLFVSVLAAIWVLGVFADAQAQGKRQEKDKKNAQVSEREKGAKDKIKYKPHGMTDADLTEWTDGNPPGWSRGEKTGWRGAGAPPGLLKKRGEQEIFLVYPRGSEDWDNKRKEDWDRTLEHSKTRILERIRAREGLSLEDEESALISIERAARQGVPLEHVEASMNGAITRGMRGRDIEKMTRAMSYGTDKQTDYGRLNRFIAGKMDAGETGDGLALSIYKEIDEQNAAKPIEPVKKPWWKRLFGR
jgi:hypothetical protein